MIWRNSNPHTLHKMISALLKTVVSYKKIFTTGPSNSIRRNLSKRNETIHPYKELYANIHRSIIIIDSNWKEFSCHQLVNRLIKCGIFHMETGMDYK